MWIETVSSLLGRFCECKNTQNLQNPSSIIVFSFGNTIEGIVCVRHDGNYVSPERRIRRLVWGEAFSPLIFALFKRGCFLSPEVVEIGIVVIYDG